MIAEIINMNGYGIYVWSSFGFTILSFISLYLVVKNQYEREKNKKLTENYYQLLLFLKFNFIFSCMVRKLNYELFLYY